MTAQEQLMKDLDIVNAKALRLHNTLQEAEKLMASLKSLVDDQPGESPVYLREFISRTIFKSNTFDEAVDRIATYLRQASTPTKSLINFLGTSKAHDYIAVADGVCERLDEKEKPPDGDFADHNFHSIQKEGFSMNDTKTLEQRVTVLEKLVAEIIALPHLSNLAGRDSSNFVRRLKMSIDSNKRKLASENLTEDERKELEERIAIDERLVSPALSSTLRDSGATEFLNAQGVHVE